MMTRRCGDVWLCLMPALDRSHAIDNIVVVLFENRSLDNVLGRLYGPEDGKNFDGVIGKDLSNPIPEWAQHGAERKVVPHTVATDMDAPNPDSGEEWFHTNTQLFGVLDAKNRFKGAEEVTEPWNAPRLARRRRWTGSLPTTSARSPPRWGVSRPTRSTPTS
jgi:phospholipase C